MKIISWDYIRKIEFEGRIFISLSIVGIVSFLCFIVFPGLPSNMIIIGNQFGISTGTSRIIGFLMISFILLLSSLLRIWAGSILSSKRIMAFMIQKDSLIIDGPYRWIRNPIYLADFIAFCAFTLVLNPVGLLLPFMIFLHYIQLIIYEEKSLLIQFGEKFILYKKNTPMLNPFRSKWSRNLKGGKILFNYDGLRHNALYVLFIPGFIVSAFTGTLAYGVLIGIPAVIDWAIMHTRIGLSHS